MSRCLIPLCILAALFSLSSLFSQVDVYETFVVERIDVNIVNAPPGAMVNPDTILSRMKTKRGRSFSQIDFDEDLKGLAQDYDDVDPCVQIAEGRIYITLNVSLKPYIRSIRWCGNRTISIARLQKELGIETGSVFDRSDFNKAVFEVRKFFVKKGFFEADIDYTIEQDCTANEVDITINVCEGRSGRIHHVRFVNFTPEEQADLEAMLVSQSWNFFYSYFSDIGTYCEEAMIQDQFIIINYLQNQGYADATVKIEPVKSKKSNHINILITADKGERYSFGAINIEGNEILTDEEVYRLIGICEGEWFSPERLQNAINRLRDYYGCQGYIDAYVEFEPTLDLEEPVYDIDFYIEEGEQYRVGLIRVLGNITTCNTVLLHECLLVPGELFNIEKLKATETRLLNMGYFSSVNVYAVRADERSCMGENYRDVHIEVVETSTGNFSAFLGLSSFEDLFGGLSICEKNFNIRGLGCLLSRGLKNLRGGGEYAYFTTTIGEKSLKYQASWAKPYILDTPWIFGVDFDRSWIRYVSDQYSLDAWGLRFYARYPMNAFMTFGMHYRMRNSNVKLDNPQTASDELKEQADQPGFISAAGITYCYDTTDHPLLPSRGIRSRFESEYAGVGGDSSFLKIGYLNNIYVPSGRYGVFKVRADLEFIIPGIDTKFTTIPIDERLFLGGICSVRGYKDFSLGNRFKNKDGKESNDDPTGGISMNLLSVEYAYRYWGKVHPFVFFDMGHLSDARLSFGRYSTSAGFGVRAFIMPGSPPLTLGMGWPINNPDDAPPKRFFFSLGGNF